jgi:hypothetical protein
MRKLLISLGLLLAACQGAGPTGVPPAAAITCHAAYRSSVTVGIEREEAVTFSGEDAEQALAFDDLEFHAAYSSGEMDNERALRLWITEPGETAVFHSQLYQLPLDSGPQNQFAGGHGFTGLNYSYHPATGAELQYWCLTTD